MAAGGEQVHEEGEEEDDVADDLRADRVHGVRDDVVATVLAPDHTAAEPDSDCRAEKRQNGPFSGRALIENRHTNVI